LQRDAQQLLERKEIAQRLGIGEGTVKSQLAEARRRLGAAQAVAVGVMNSLIECPTSAHGGAGAACAGG
jgi:hypothetical protein